jgi:hypothetical protein
MDPGKLAQARRFYHHVYNGGTLKPNDVSYMVQALEEAYAEIEQLKQHSPGHGKDYNSLDKGW